MNLESRLFYNVKICESIDYITALDDNTSRYLKNTICSGIKIFTLLWSKYKIDSVKSSLSFSFQWKKRNKNWP